MTKTIATHLRPTLPKTAAGVIRLHAGRARAFLTRDETAAFIRRARKRSRKVSVKSLHQSLDWRVWRMRSAAFDARSSRSECHLPRWDRSRLEFE